MKVKPLHDWTIIKRHEPKQKTAGGIIIPDVARDIPTEGTVIAIGPGRYKKEPGKKTKFIPTTLKPGQRIYFMEYATQEIELDGEEIIFIREEDILGTLEDDKQLVVKKPHPVEAKQEQPVIVHGTAGPLPLVPLSEKEVIPKKPTPKKKPVTKKKRTIKEKAVSRTRKPSTKAKAKKTTKKKTAKTAKKVTFKKTAKKALKKKTSLVTKKKTKTAKKSVKRVAQKSVKGKKATPKKKSKRSSKKKT